MGEQIEQVQEKEVAPILVAGLRMKGKYSDCGTGFGKIGRKFGRHLSGAAMLLCYDTEYRADDADYEVCMPVRRGTSIDDITVRELPGGRCLSLIHHGPYEELHRSYDQIRQYAGDHDHKVLCPSREVYHKGPGMVFRGNPKKYRTEIQFMLDVDTP